MRKRSGDQYCPMGKVCEKGRGISFVSWGSGGGYNGDVGAMGSNIFYLYGHDRDIFMTYNPP